ncbi:MAG: hypothetical protein WBD07_00475 [Vicinamibacterales bacterium]
MLLSKGSVAAQSLPAPSDARPFEITDNSMLIEEAFNQEPGIFQNIFGFVHSGSSWDAAFTQEWPLGTQKHQISYTVPFASLAGQRGVGDIQIHYRYQAVTEGPGRAAFSPRFTVILPSGNADKNLGSGVIGWQVNLPFSKQRNDLYFHANGGFTHLAGVDSGAVPADEVSLLTPHLAASGIWRIRPMLNVLVENVFEWAQEVDGPGTTGRTAAFTVSPGARGGWNLGDHQLIVGLAAPLTWSDGAMDAGVFVYLSHELPFRR